MRRRPDKIARVLRIGLVALAIGALACSGRVTGEQDDSGREEPGNPPDHQGSGGVGVPSRACETKHANPRPLTHLTRSFYNNTVRDLIGDDTRPADAFPLDDSLSGFEVGRDVSDRLASDFVTAAANIAAAAVLRLDGLLDCSTRDRACAVRFVSTFLTRAFRRPVTPEEESEFMALFDEASSRYDFATGIQLVVQTALSSPQFLYLHEEEERGAWATAARLSYFLNASMPDDELMAAAAEGRLQSVEDLERQAFRLIDGPLFAESLMDLARQWFGLADIRHIAKPQGALSASGAQALERSALGFVRGAMVESDSWRRLMLGTEVHVDQELAQLYGVPVPAKGEWHVVDAPEQERAGILTQAGLLAKLGKALKPDAIHRGVFVRRALLCEELAPPPEVPPLPEGENFSDQLKSHVANPACRGCHELIDPVGFAFDVYDGLGRYRTTDEQGRPILAEGDLKEAGSASGPFVGVRALAEKLSESDVVAGCVAKRMFRHASRRAEQEHEECALDGLREKFGEGDVSFKWLALAIARLPSFPLAEAQK